jgi:hypothetical protein
MPAQRVKGRGEGRRCHGVAWARDLRHLPGYWPSFFYFSVRLTILTNSEKLATLHKNFIVKLHR